MILNPAPSIIFRIAPALPASKASGLIMVNVLFPAMVVGVALVYFGCKNSAF
jgi:hypothetical protein